MRKAEKVFEMLNEAYPDAKCGLDYGTPFQLLVSTVLSAQATDKSVNKVTENLYKEYPDAQSFMKLTQDEIADKIKTIGLYKNKSKSIYNLCRQLIDMYGGEVPNSMEELMKLSGVGRKTASVVLVEGFKIPAFPVDTHVFRVTKRIGLAKENTADKVSDEMMKQLPKKTWHDIHHLLIAHGRQTCSAQSPKCEACCVQTVCDYYKEMQREQQLNKK